MPESTSGASAAPTFTSSTATCRSRRRSSLVTRRSARVERLGAGVTADFNGEPLQEGDAIAWASNIPCGHCYWCVVEKERTLCENRKVYGINQRFDEGPRLSGGWAEVHLSAARLGDLQAAGGHLPRAGDRLGCAGPTAVHGVLEIVGIGVGETVVVQGSGPVGLAAAMYAQWRARHGRSWSEGQRAASTWRGRSALAMSTSTSSPPRS